MGLAPYGEPRFADRILSQLIDLKDRRLVPHGHDLLQLLRGAADDLARSSTICSTGRRGRREARLTQREMDIAASIQAVTEEIMLRCARHVHAETGMRNLCLAGGVALNCVGQRAHPARRPF